MRVVREQVWGVVPTTQTNKKKGGEEEAWEAFHKPDPPAFSPSGDEPAHNRGLRAGE